MHVFTGLPSWQGPGGEITMFVSLEPNEHWFLHIWKVRKTSLMVLMRNVYIFSTYHLECTVVQSYLIFSEVI